MLVAFCLFMCQAAHASERVALVVGNSTYKTSPLFNPENDARDMAKLLGQAGFQVLSKTNATRDELEKVVADFGKRLSDPKVKVAVFYYAGHGVQLDWRNYLIPVDAAPRSADDLRKQSIDVSALLTYMQRAQQKGRSFLIVLDACRDDPFAGSYKPEAKGLSQFDAPSGSLLAYSTSPGKVAIDGVAGASNGLYTAYLLKELAKRGAPIEDAFKRTRLNVRLASNGTQIPWESTSLEDDLYLFPGEVKKLSEREQEVQLDTELRSWSKVKDTADPYALAEFLREYPSGNLSEIATNRMNRLLGSQSNAESTRLIAKNLAVVEAKQAQEERDKAQAVRVAQEAAAALAQAAAVAQAQRAAELDRIVQAARARIAEEARLADVAQAKAEQEEVARAQVAKEQSLLAQAAKLAFELAQTAARQAATLAAAQNTAREAAAKIALEAAQSARLAAIAAAARQEAQRVALEQAATAKALAAQQESTRVAALADATRREEARVAAVQAESDRIKAVQIAQAQRQAEDVARLSAERQETQRLAAERLRIEEVQAARLAQAANEAKEAQVAAAAQEQSRLAKLQAEQATQDADKVRIATAQRAQAEQTALAQAQTLAAEQQQRQAASTLAAANAQAAAQAAREAAQARVALALLADTRVALADRPSEVAVPIKVVATPFYKGSNEFNRFYTAGDRYEFRVIDLFNRSEKPLVMEVTSVDLANERVTYNNGDYSSDLMGNILSNLRGASATPRQFYPAELFVGKRWRTRFKQVRPNGVSYTFSYEMRVVARETVTVPAGTFETFKIEGRGFNVQLRAAIERNIWVSPGINADIALETIVRLDNGAFDQRERQELVAYTAKAQNVALAR